MAAEGAGRHRTLTDSAEQVRQTTLDVLGDQSSDNRGDCQRKTADVDGP
jgi:hypothetical protein